MSKGSARFCQVPSGAISDKRLGERHLRVLLAIGMYSNREHDGWCWPSRATLEEVTGIKHANVSRIVSDLSDFGYIKVEKQGTRNRYWIDMNFVLDDQFHRANRDEGVSSDIFGKGVSSDTYKVSPATPLDGELLIRKENPRENPNTLGKQGKSEPSEDVIRVFEQFKSLIKPGARLGAAETKKLEAGLKQNPVDDVLRAIEIASRDYGNDDFKGWRAFLEDNGPAWMFLKPNRLANILSTRPRNGNGKTSVKAPEAEYPTRVVEGETYYVADEDWDKLILDARGRPGGYFLYSPDMLAESNAWGWDIRIRADGLGVVLDETNPQWDTAIPLRKPHSGVSR